MRKRLSLVVMLVAWLAVQVFGQTGETVYVSNFVGSQIVEGVDSSTPTAPVLKNHFDFHLPFKPCNDWELTDEMVTRLSGVYDGISEWPPVDPCRHTMVVVTALLNSASLTAMPAAPESWITLTGVNLADTPISATTSPLPHQLGTTQVTIRDSAGKEQTAPLKYVSQEMINFLMPDGVALGNATLTVTSSRGRSHIVPFLVEPISPALFTANSTGSGVPAAQAMLLRSNGARSPVPVFACSNLPASCKPVPILSPGDRDRLVLSLYATGIRGNTDPANVQVKIGGVSARVLYAGRQSQYAGLDQVNVEIPKSMAGDGLVDLALTVDGKAANIVQIELQ